MKVCGPSSGQRQAQSMGEACHQSQGWCLRLYRNGGWEGKEGKAAPGGLHVGVGQWGTQDRGWDTMLQDWESDFWLSSRGGGTEVTDGCPDLLGTDSRPNKGFSCYMKALGPFALKVGKLRL